MYKVTTSKYDYNWSLSDLKNVKPNSCNAFGTFVCGGGSSMGYKLAGYNHLGGVEFTDHYAKLYKKNLDPKHLFVEDIRDFNKRKDLPAELYDLDLLDGSPPCAAFSSVGAREKLWGKKSEYEGKQQVKDDLVFIYGDTVLKLRPKVFLLENVSGLLKGNAKSYVRKIVAKVSKEYNVQVFSLNAASMGVPQMRQRVFFIGVRKGFKLPKLVLDFDCPTISFEEATKEHWGKGGDCIKKHAVYQKWLEVDWPNKDAHPIAFGVKRPKLNRPCPTITESASNAGSRDMKHPIHPRTLNKHEAQAIQSYPTDYDYLDQKPLSCIGRSVPPVMMAQIANQIYLQWLSKIKS